MAGSCGVRRVEDPRPGGEERVGLLLGEHQRRREPDPLGGRVVDDEAGLEGGGERPRRSAASVRSSPISRPVPRTSVTRSSAASPSRSALADLGGVLEQAVLLDRVRCTASAAAAATGLPPKVVPWLPGWSRSAASPVAMQAPIGKPPARPLATVTMSAGAVHRVGDGGVLVGEPGAGAADAGLDLVEPQQGAVLAGDLAGLGEVVERRRDHAGLALERLEDHGRGLVGDGGGERRRRRRTARR